MSTLQERLDRMKAGFLKQASEEAKRVMASAEEALRGSGIMSRLPAEGSLLPAFALNDTEGRTVRSADLLAGGPLVVNLYRGQW